MGPETTFFSYARSDSDFVLKLARDLRQAGADVWLDQLDIKAGSRWDLSVETALKKSSKMVVILSPESVASNNVMDEVAFALEEGKTVIPVLLKSCDIPFRLRRLQHADFTKNYDEGLENLLQALNLEELIPGHLVKDDSGPAIKEAQVSEKDENKNKAEDEKPKGEAEAKRHVEERKLKEQSEAERLEEQRKFKEQAERAKIENKSKKISEAPTFKKNKYKTPIIVAGIILVFVIVIWIVNTGRHDKGYQVNLAIGQEYQGGIIFYIDSSGQHGLIVAPIDQSKEIEWGEYSILTEATGKVIGTGRSNTDKIVAKLGAGEYAAKLCADLQLNEYDDWFLPSKDELEQLYINHDKVGGFSDKFADQYYWSSSEYSATNAWLQYFVFDHQNSAIKKDSYCVRAIRSF